MNEPHAPQPAYDERPEGAEQAEEIVEDRNPNERPAEQERLRD